MTHHITRPRHPISCAALVAVLAAALLGAFGGGPAGASDTDTQAQASFAIADTAVESPVAVVAPVSTTRALPAALSWAVLVGVCALAARWSRLAFAARRHPTRVEFRYPAPRLRGPPVRPVSTFVAP